MKNIKMLYRKISAILLIICLLIVPSVTFAQEGSEGSITAQFADKDCIGEITTFSLYKISDENNEILDPFKDYPVEINFNTKNSLLNTASSLLGYIKKDNLEPDFEVETDEEGKFQATNLSYGTYLVAGDNFIKGDVKYEVQPFIISIPYDDIINLEVLIKTKKTLMEVPDEKIVRKVLKVWDDEGREEYRPESITVNLLKDGEVYEEVELNRENNWKYTWDDLSVKNEWLVVEENVEGYTVSTELEGITFVITNKSIIPPEPEPTPPIFEVDPTPTPTPTETPSEDPSEEPTPTPTPTPTPDESPEPTPTPSPTPDLSDEPTKHPSVSDPPTPTPDQSETPTPDISEEPSESPSIPPVFEEIDPTEEPTPTPDPTESIDPSDTPVPSESATDTPTQSEQTPNETVNEQPINNTEESLIQNNNNSNNTKNTENKLPQTGIIWIQVIIFGLIGVILIIISIIIEGFNRKNTNKLRRLLLIIGLILILIAGVITFYNINSSEDIGKNTIIYQEELDKRIEKQYEIARINEANGNNEEIIPDYILNPKADIPIEIIDGNEFVGKINFVNLGKEFPVLSEWSYDNLHIAPCRYSGSVYTNNMVICGHNTKNQFGFMDEVSTGDIIEFIDVDGNIFSYKVMSIEEIDPYYTDIVNQNDFDFALFACNSTGLKRIFVKCDLITQE